MDAVAILGVIAAAILLVVLTHRSALRKYADLLDPDTVFPPDGVSGQVRGRIGGRTAAISLSLPRRRPRRPGELRVSLECSAPLTLRVEREGLSSGLLKAAGIRSDRRTGDEELDRTFLFQFQDRARLTACIERAELGTSLLRLAGLGVGSVQVEQGTISASVPLRLILPPRVELVREVVFELAAAATAMERALGVGPGTERSAPVAGWADDRAPGRRDLRPSRVPRARAVHSLPVLVAVLFVAIALAYAIAAPMWDRSAHATAGDSLALMQTRVMLATLAAGAAGFLAALLGGSRPLLWGLGLGAPMLLYSGAIWVYFLIFQTAGVPIVESILAETAGLVTNVLTLLTAAPVLLLVSGWAGARVASSRRRGER